MKTEITFEQIAHLYLRSELKLVEQYYPTSKASCDRIFLGIEKSGWYKTSYGGKKSMSACANWNGISGYMPLFSSFENLIKPVKANKFVAELLVIEECSEYIMMKEISKLTYGGITEDWIKSDFELKYQPYIKEHYEDAREYISSKFEAAYMGSVNANYEVTIESNFIVNVAYRNEKHGRGIIGISNQPLIQTLLIAAGYNIYNIKDCKYE